MELDGGATRLYVVLVICMSDGCVRRTELINVISGISEDDLDAFFEGYDESEPADHCPACGALGIAYDPIEEEILSKIHKGDIWRKQPQQKQPE